MSIDDMFADPAPAPKPARDAVLFEDDNGFIREGSTSRTMPHPLTGLPTEFVRASHFASSLSDSMLINWWKLAMNTIGIAKNRGLYAKAHSLPIPEESIELRGSGWWMPFYEIAKQAIDYAGGNISADLGIAFHNNGEALDRGILSIDQILPEYQKHAQAFLDAHEEAGLYAVPEYLERLVVNLKVGSKGLWPDDDFYQGSGRAACGRLDALKRTTEGDLVVDDTKTGKAADKGADEIAIQCAIYANSEWIFDPETGAYVPMPAEVRKDIAYITHVPINRPEDTRVIPIDIAWGWEAVKHASWAWEYRNAGRRKFNGIKLSQGKIKKTRG